jgi:hypothetical protein
VEDPFSGEHVASVTRRIAAPPSDVWSVLANGWLYATWVVGASRIRAVDPAWPQPGAKVHHSFGIWPLVIDDDTTVVSADPERELVLRAKGWPAGEATVRLLLTADGPVRQLGVLPRNKESLRRLGFLAEGRRKERTGDTSRTA